MTDQTRSNADEKVIKSLLSLKQVIAFFQPVVSIAARGVVGFEAFVRPSGEYSSIDTRALFDGSLGSDVMLEMDRLCRATALKQFKSVHDRHKSMLLFLKVNADSLPHLETDQFVLTEQLNEAGVAVESVVLEMPYVHQHMERSVPLFEKIRENNVKLCLDNCAVDSAVSYALNLLRPDFVKLNRSFFAAGENAEHAAATLVEVVGQASRLGTQVLAQGVEAEEESVRLLSAGVSLQQGYYYSKEEGVGSDDMHKHLRDKIVQVNKRFMVARQQGIRRKKDGFTEAFRKVGKASSKLANLPEQRFDEACRSLAAAEGGPISLFVLDSKGVQITERSCADNSCVFGSSGAIYGFQKGTDHSSQDYALYIEMGYNQFVTQPFTSLVSGDLACLISKPFYNAQGDLYILCVETEYPA